MEYKLELVKKYFSLVENFNNDRSELAKILHPEITATEFPNLFTTNLPRTRNFEQMLEAIPAGKKFLKKHHFEIETMFETPEVLVIEAVWTGEMADSSRVIFEKDKTLTAHCCFIFEFKDSKIFRQRNYDCYENPGYTYHK